MSRALRIEYQGAVYHVLSRGNEKATVFLSDDDRTAFIRTLAKASSRYNLVCHAYCLMENHYHLLVETPDGNLSRGMHYLNGVYTQKFNGMHKRVGHLFQGRYKAILIEKDAYLLQLTRYIVMNPVRAGLVEDPALWRWSSYRATANLEPSPEFLCTDWILRQFKDGVRPAHAGYSEFVVSEQTNPLAELGGGVVLGSEAFIERFREQLWEKDDEKEIIREQRFADRPALSDLFSLGMSRQERNFMIVRAVVDYGYSLKETSDSIGLHYTTVSRLLKKQERQQ